METIRSSGGVMQQEEIPGCSASTNVLQHKYNIVIGFIWIYDFL